MTWQWLGDRAVRFLRPPGVSARALLRELRGWAGVEDVVVAPGDVAVYFERPGPCSGMAPEPERLAALAQLANDDRDDASSRTIELRAVYDGADLDELTRATGVDVARVHAAGEYRVDAMGFQPGFAYLTGLDPRLASPRLATPRTRVPAGAIGIADTLTGVYPFASPGGWRLIGRVVDAPMFDASGPRLALGDRVRFVP
jgi:UPF0271 protein